MLEVDADGSGEIDFEELKEALTALGQEHDDEKVQQMMSEHGGQQGTITFTNFIKLVSSEHTKLDIKSNAKV